MSQETAAPDPPSLSRRAFSAATARRAEFRHAIRVSVAVGTAFACGALFHLPQAYWAVFTAVIVVQTSVGGTITASMERLAGTVVGAAIGAAAAYVRASTVVGEGLTLSLAIAIAAFAAAVRPSLRVAPVTAAIVLVGGVTTRMDPVVAAAWRVVEIFLGSAIGVAATLLIFPARARKAIAERAAQMMAQMSRLLELFVQQLAGKEVETDVHAAHQAIRKILGQVEQAINESARESVPGFARTQPPDGLLRSLRRISNDGIMVGRALSQPLPDPVRELLTPGAEQVLEAAAAALDASAGAIRTRAAPPEGGLVRPRAVFEDAVEHVRAAKLTSDLGFDAAARVFGLVFALESLLANLSDLEDRVADLADQARPSAGTGVGAGPPAP